MAPRRDDIATRTEARRALAAAVFPELRYGDDPDLDRYLELRKDGRVGDALAVYNGALRSRYPDDGERALLIALKRSRDPRWLELQARLLDALADRVASRLAANVELLLRAASVANSRDAWGSLGAVDALLGRLGAGSTAGASASPEAAIAAVEQHLKLARILEALDAAWAPRIRGLERALGLLEEYAALARLEAPEAQDFVARSRALEDRRRSLSRPRSPGQIHEESTDFVARSRARLAETQSPKGRHFFDLERIRFSRAEVAAIELASPPARHEDLVIAWCAKYWRAALDPRFERSVFLYSRKFGTRHFEIYRELRAARLRRRSDDEILTAMSSLLSAGYSYSVTGDLYMQRRWAAVKASLFEEAPPVPPSPPRLPTSSARTVTVPAPGASLAGGDSPSSTRAALSRPGRRGSPRPAPARSPRESDPPSGGAIPKPLPRAPLAPSRGASRPGSSPVGASPSPSPRGSGKARDPAGTAPRAAAKVAGRISATPAKVVGRRLTRAAHRTTPLAAPTSSREAVPNLARRNSGSISDRVRRLSGKRYDVYKNIFLERVRDSIHRTLLGSRTKQGGIFDTSANEAEDLVYGFITGHYEDPFMDWEASRERGLVEGLGFSLPSLDPIVEDCYRRL